MKKLAAAALTAGLLVGSCTTAWAADPTIYYNGNELKMNETVVIQDNRTMLAVRDITQQMGMSVTWDNATRVAKTTYKDKEILFQPDLHRVVINGEVQQVDVGPAIINNRIYLPLRYLFELTDADVFFRKYDDGHQVVSVNSRDSYVNYIKTNGRVTTAVRQVESGVLDSQVLMTRDGNVMEVHMKGSSLEIHRTTQTLARVENIEEDRVLHKEITGLMDKGGKYYAVLDAKQQPFHIGTGYYPTGTPLLDKIQTPQGEYRFYESVASIETFALEGKEGFHIQAEKGHMLGIGSDNSIKDADYAFTGNDLYGFLTDGQFLLIGNNPSQGYHVITCKTINNTMKDGKLFYNADDTFFYAIGVDKAANGQEELFVTAYTSEGMKTLSYIPISNYGDAAYHRYVDIVDSIQIDNVAYFLLKTDTDLYLANYDLTAHKFDSEKLMLPYEKFAMAKGGWQLYYGDDETYHFYALK